MQWSSVGNNKAAVVGFNAMGEFFNNHPQSGTQNIASSISCTELGRRKRRFVNINDNFICPMPAVNCHEYEGIFKEMCYCISRLSVDLNITFTPDEVVDKLDPCPHTSEQAQNDKGRFVKQKLNDSLCYVSGRTVVINDISFTQQCCYDIDLG